LAQNWETHALCSAAELLRAIQAVKPVEANGSWTTRFTFSAARSKIESNSGAFEEVDALVTGPEATVLLNARYISRFLQQMQTSQLRLAFSSQQDVPALFSSCGDQQNYRMVLMPMKDR